MAKESGTRDGAAAETALRKAFAAVEAQPVPSAVAEHAVRLTVSPPRPDRRS